MSLKSIELQIAIPKTVEAGKLQEQKQNQTYVSQTHAQAANEKELAKQRETVVEATNYAKVNKDANKEQHPNGQNEQGQGHKEEEKKTKHPYKGSFVDFIG